MTPQKDISTATEGASRNTANSSIQIFSGNANRPLAEEICTHLGRSLGKASVTTFSDGEIFIRLDESVRGRSVFVVQSLSHPINNHVMELLIMIDALKRASAGEITAVVPYYGYARQDRKDQPRVPITAKLLADLVVTAGADRVMTLDLHAGQIQGFFNIPVDHLYSAPVLLSYFKAKAIPNWVVVSPDAGGVERARVFAKRLDATLAIIDKRREGPNKTQIMNIVGEVKGRHALVLDDMIDTAGTISQAAAAVKRNGAEAVTVACTHPVFSGPAVDRLNAAPIDEIVVTNTIPLVGKEIRRLTVLSVGPLLGEAILRTHGKGSVSSLFA